MAVKDSEQPRYGAVNASRSDAIARLRKRVKEIGWDKNTDAGKIRGALEGIIDLLADDAP